MLRVLAREDGHMLRGEDNFDDAAANDCGNTSDRINASCSPFVSSEA